MAAGARDKDAAARASAFTLGHSVTLLAGALRWLTLPQQPVEVLIACSVLVTAIHAIRPIFPGREQQVAAGFGLVHGLAFATVLADLHLPAGPLALSILGFNLGIELLQLFVLALTVPWLILLSLTPVHRRVRTGGAVLAAVAAAGWIVNRVSGESNWIERGMSAITSVAPIGIFILATIAIVAYLTSTARRTGAGLSERTNPREKDSFICAGRPWMAGGEKSRESEFCWRYAAFCRWPSPGTLLPGCGHRISA
jgi:hypothetical protein